MVCAAGTIIGTRYDSPPWAGAAGGARGPTASPRGTLRNATPGWPVRRGRVRLAIRTRAVTGCRSRHCWFPPAVVQPPLAQPAVAVAPPPLAQPAVGIVGESDCPRRRLRTLHVGDAPGCPFCPERLHRTREESPPLAPSRYLSRLDQAPETTMTGRKAAPPGRFASYPDDNLDYPAGPPGRYVHLQSAGRSHSIAASGPGKGTWYPMSYITVLRNTSVLKSRRRDRRGLPMW